ncbi:spore protease YyaC [Lacrimispora sp. JR3]|uniref:spore protease YyaC n=1 Tax=Lacrimispora sinapis TaxID=3111456 RepID=UPI00374968E4
MKLWERIAIRGNRDVFYYDTKHTFEAEDFASRLYDMISTELENKKAAGVLFLCIGTDRSTGDSLGPLIGYKLKDRGLEHLEVMGTLERPVHAMNLETYQTILRLRYPNYVVVAVDASVGNMEHIGYVTLGRGALKPGLGVSKELRAVGDIFITGIVGSCGNYDPLMLQSIRLSVVMRMADCISHSIYLVEKLWENTSML